MAGGAVAAAVLVLAAPVPASAGGPTSVLIVSPGRQATASLYTTDEAYTRLEKLLGDNPTADPAAPDLHGGPGTDAINVTWLAHDVWIWRVDRIFTDAPQGPWVETFMPTESGIDFSKPGVRHAPSDSDGLMTLLSALRLLGEPPPAYAGAKAPVTQQQPAPAATVSESAPPDRGWLWLVLGIAAGAVLVIGFRPLARRLRPQLASGHG
ncbi:MAG TPA: hypothetical protein VGR06_15215 [Actinophytocola sp.]|jgi:hypothetical protein|uniref:hypothetical protein n=1 Tax=Actinophytocola sp. TaxID=1872138 RepID=UPI002E0CB545|nr:hypothetical protein [Actinophytocola sp.]